MLHPVLFMKVHLRGLALLVVFSNSEVHHSYFRALTTSLDHYLYLHFRHAVVICSVHWQGFHSRIIFYFSELVWLLLHHLQFIVIIASILSRPHHCRVIARLCVQVYVSTRGGGRHTAWRAALRCAPKYKSSCGSMFGQRTFSGEELQAEPFAGRSVSTSSLNIIFGDTAELCVSRHCSALIRFAFSLVIYVCSSLRSARSQSAVGAQFRG